MQSFVEVQSQLGYHFVKHAREAPNVAYTVNVFSGELAVFSLGCIPIGCTVSGRTPSRRSILASPTPDSHQTSTPKDLESHNSITLFINAYITFPGPFFNDPPGVLVSGLYKDSSIQRYQHQTTFSFFSNHGHLFFMPYRPG